MATEVEGFISGAATGAATGSIAGPFGAVIGGIAGGLLGGFSTKTKNDALREQAQENYDKILDYTTKNYQNQLDYINFNSKKLKKQYNDEINNRALKTLQERASVRNSLISNNIEGNISKRINSVVALTGATDIGILEKKLSDLLYEQEISKKNYNVQRNDMLNNVNSQNKKMLEETKSDKLGTLNNVLNGALNVYTGLNKFGTFNSSQINQNSKNIQTQVNNQNNTSFSLFDNIDNNNISNQSAVINNENNTSFSLFDNIDNNNISNQSAVINNENNTSFSLFDNLTEIYKNNVETNDIKLFNNVEKKYTIYNKIDKDFINQENKQNINNKNEGKFDVNFWEEYYNGI